MSCYSTHDDWFYWVLQNFQELDQCMIIATPTCQCKDLSIVNIAAVSEGATQLF